MNNEVTNSVARKGGNKLFIVIRKHVHLWGWNKDTGKYNNGTNKGIKIEGRYEVNETNHANWLSIIFKQVNNNKKKNTFIRKVEIRFWKIINDNDGNV